MLENCALVRGVSVIFICFNHNGKLKIMATNGLEGANIARR